MEPIIRSLLDTDLYKFTMLQVVLHKFPQTHSVYQFRCRNLEDTVYPLTDILDDLNEQLDYLCELRFQDDELQYLRNLRFIKSDFVDYLELFQLKRRFVKVFADEQNRLSIRVEGPMIQAMFFEIYILAMVNELYFRRLETPEVLAEGERRLQEKIALLKQYDQQQNPNEPPFLVSDFGTRRRYTLAWQEHVVHSFHQAAPNIFRGTSNVYLAKKWNVTPVGTMAHEWIMCTGQGNHKHNPAYSNWYALDAWVKEYGILNGIALTDTITTDCFLKDFQLTYSTLFSGVRHDSGDPFAWGEKMIAHYEFLGIDPKRKTLLFSDGLDFARADELRKAFRDRVTVAFGIGTYIANDTCEEPLNIVMKTTKCNGMDVAKISDTPGKGM